MLRRTVVLATILLAGCGTAHQLAPTEQRAPVVRLAGGAPRHVAVIVMENEEYGDVLSAPSTPFIHALVRGGAVATQMYAVAHPSLPNYLALATGSTHGITDDCSDCTVPGSGLAGQLAAAGVAWRAYMEDLPHPCFSGAEAGGGYARKHDPFIYENGIRATPSACAKIVPLTRLAADEAARSLPRFAWITPNLCHDIHDCDPPSGDRFLAATVPGLMRAMGPRSLLILTWDEGSSDNGCCRLAHGGHILTVLSGPLARPATRVATPVDHYSTLQLIEDLLGVPRLGGAACTCTPSLAPLLRGRARRRG